MIENIPGNLLKILDLTGAKGALMHLEEGMLLKAKVISITENGNAVLRLIAPGSGKGRVLEAVIQQNMQSVLKKGDELILEIVGNRDSGDDKISVKIKQSPGERHISTEAVRQDTNAFITGKSGRVPGAAVRESGLKLLLNVIKAYAAISKQQKDAETLLTMNVRPERPDVLKQGTVIKAEITGTNKNGNTVVRLIMPDTGQLHHVQAEIIKKSPEVLLKKGREITIEIVGGKRHVKARLVNGPEQPVRNLPQTIQPVLFNTLSTISGSELSNSEMKLVINILRSLSAFSALARPDIKSIEHSLLNTGKINRTFLRDITATFSRMQSLSTGVEATSGSGQESVGSDVKLLLNLIRSLPAEKRAEIPGHAKLEKLYHAAGLPNAKELKTLIERSGPAFETRLRHAVINRKGKDAGALTAFRDEGDLKGLALKIREMLHDRGVIKELVKAGLNLQEISNTAERIIQNIEVFQTASRLSDMFCTFLPLLWSGFRDGEFLFRKHRRDGKNMNVCDLNLDLKVLGKLSVSITQFRRSFYITFYTEKPEVRALIDSHRYSLEERFSSQGLTLKVLNVNQKDEIFFGQSQYHSVNCRA